MGGFASLSHCVFVVGGVGRLIIQFINLLGSKELMSLLD